MGIQWRLHCPSVASFRSRRPGPYERNAAISWHFEHDPIPYALDTDWPVGAAGLEPPHLGIKSGIAIDVLACSSSDFPGSLGLPRSGISTRAASSSPIASSLPRTRPSQPPRGPSHAEDPRILNQSRGIDRIKTEATPKQSAAAKVIVNKGSQA